jgi:probable phosphoglycerate mutase
MTTHLYLIRHGEAYANAEDIIGGVTGCRGLTPAGRRQAEQPRRRLERGAIAADALYSSTLPRARETAEIVAPALHVPIQYDAALQELCEGVADGMRRRDARRQYPALKTVHTRVFTPVAPEGERWASFQLRVSGALERIITGNLERRIVVICHGGVIEASFFHLMQLPPQLRSSNSFEVGHTALTHWHQHVRRDGRVVWYLGAHNDDRHLHGLEAGSGVA